MFFFLFLPCCLKGYDLKRKRKGGHEPHSQKGRFSNEQILIRDQIMKMPEFSGFQTLGLLTITCELWGFPPPTLSFVDHSQHLLGVTSATGTVAAGFLGVCRTDERVKCAAAQRLLSSVEPDKGTEPMSGVAAGCTRLALCFEKYSLISSGNFSSL